MTKNRLQELCSGPEFAMGELYAIREFKTGLSDGRPVLTAVMHPDVWKSSSVATCAAAPTSLTKDMYEIFKSLPKGALEASGMELIGPPEDKDDDDNDTFSVSGTAYIGLNTITAGGLTANYIYAGANSYLSGGLSNPKYALRRIHDVPDPDCTCGFYAYHSVAALHENGYNTDWTGIVRAYGKIVVGSKGIRAEKADVVALVPSPSFLKGMSFSSSSTSPGRVSTRRAQIRGEASAQANELVNQLESNTLPAPLPPAMTELMNICSREIVEFRGLVQDRDKQVAHATYKSDSKLSYVEFNMLYLATAGRATLDRRIDGLRAGFISRLTELLVDEILASDPGIMISDAEKRVGCFTGIATDRMFEVLVNIAHEYPNAVFFKNVDDMLREFPLTGVDDFIDKDLNEDDLD